MDARIKLFQLVISQLCRKGKTIQIYDPSSEEGIFSLLSALSLFDENIPEMKDRSEITKFPKFMDFYKNMVNPGHDFNAYKCENDACKYHKVSGSGEITPLSDPVLVHGEEDGQDHY